MVSKRPIGALSLPQPPKGWDEDIGLFLRVTEAEKMEPLAWRHLPNKLERPCQPWTTSAPTGSVDFTSLTGGHWAVSKNRLLN